MNVVNSNIKGSSDKISIDFSDKEKLDSKSTVRDVKEDKRKKNEIKDISDKSIVLKEVGYGIDGFGINKTIHTDSDSNQIVVKEQLEKKSKSKDDANEKRQEEKKSAEGIGSRITAKDYARLMAEGDIQKAYDVIRLDKALSRIKGQSQERRKGIEEQAKDLAEDKDAIVQIAYNTHSNTKAQEDVGKLLEESNLPITEENILKVSTAIELSGRLSNISDKDMSYMIRNSLEPTIENLYKATYSNLLEKASPLSEEEKEQLQLQIETILTESGYESNIENEGKAIWLIEHKIPLTKENLASLNQLYSISDSMAELDYQDSIIDKIIASVEAGIAPEKTDLSVISKEVLQVVETIRESTEDTVKVATQMEDSVTISTLADAKQYLKNNSHANLNLDDTRYIKAKRQLEEIRLQMTVDVAQKMADKGIQLDTTELSSLVEELKVIENTYYSNLLKEGNVTESSENILWLQETTQALEEMKTLPSYVLGKTLEQKDIATLSLIHAEGKDIQTHLEKARESYETLMTEPRRDLGDSIQKAFDSTDYILDELDLEATQSNKRAVRILAYNQMEVTKESIQEVKIYDTMVNHLIKDMHPAVVVDMIKEGKNPLDIPLEELSQSIALRKEELGIAEEEKYSTYLWKLEREEGITPEERKSYIGIYRLLNNVEKTDGAALGSVIKADQEITMNNLLTAVRTIKNKGLDVAIDDEYGALEELTYSKENITSQIEAGYEQHKKSNQSDGLSQQVDYIEGLLGHIMEDISPGKLSSIAESMGTNGQENNGEKLLNLSVETLYEELQTATEKEEVSKTYYGEQVDNIRETLDNVEGPLALLNNLNMPATIAHISAANEYLYQDTKTYRKLHEVMDNLGDEEICERIKESMNHIPEALTNEEVITEEYEKLSENVSQLVNKALEDPNIISSDIINLKSINQGMRLITNLSNSRNYEIPLLVGDKITNVNLKIITGQGKTSKVDIKVQSEALGNIDASFTIKDEEIKGLILCDNREGLYQLKENQQVLEERIQEKGLTLKQLNYGGYQINKSLLNTTQEAEQGEKTSNTHKLYEVAKLLIYHIKDIELQRS